MILTIKNSYLFAILLGTFITHGQLTAMEHNTQEETITFTMPLYEPSGMPTQCITVTIPYYPKLKGNNRVKIKADDVKEAVKKQFVELPDSSDIEVFGERSDEEIPNNGPSWPLTLNWLESPLIDEITVVRGESAVGQISEVTLQKSDFQGLVYHDGGKLCAIVGSLENLKRFKK